MSTLLAVSRRPPGSLPYVAFLAAITLVLYATGEFGPGVSHDSTNYLSAAKSIAESRDLLDVTGNPFVNWPPLYPILLASFSWVHTDLSKVAIWMNAFLFGSIAYSASIFFRSISENKWVSFLGTLLVVVSVPLLHVSVYIWSEPLYILLSLLSFLSLGLNRERVTNNNIILCGVFTFLAVFTRYIGVTNYLAVVIFLLLFSNDNFKKRIYQTIIFSAIVCIPFSLLLFYNNIHSGTMFGMRYPSDVSFLQNLKNTVDVLTGWMFPYRIQAIVRIMITALLIFVGLPYVFRSVKFSPSKYLRNTPPSHFFVILYFFIYIGFIVYSSTKYAIDAIDSRLLAPVYLPLLFCMMVMMVVLMESEYKIGKTKLQMAIFRLFNWQIFFIFLLLPILVMIVRTRDLLVTCRSQGAGGYTSLKWRNSQTILALDGMNYKGRIISNAPDFIYFKKGIRVVQSPKIHEYNYKTNIKGIEEFTRYHIDNTSIIVWLDSMSNVDLYTPEEISKYTPITPVRILSDGIIYRVGKK